MARAQIDQLGWQLDVGRRRLQARLAGLEDEEYLWEPVEGCWNVRPRGEAVSPHPMGRGEWIFDYDAGQPSPAPFTTIAWRLMHLTDVLGSYHAHLWGDPTIPDDWLEVAPTAAPGLALWDEHAGRFAAGLEADSDGSLAEMIRIPWWPVEAPRWRVVGIVLDELLHHGAEMAALRDLFAKRGSWRGE